MQPSSESPKPSPLSMPRRRQVPAATPDVSPGPGFSDKVPHCGRPDAIYHLDTGILYSAGRDESCAHKFVKHFAGRLHTTDIIVGEIQNRADSKVTEERQLEKNAAQAALQRLIDKDLVVIDELLSEEDFANFDMITHQLRELEARRNGHATDAYSNNKHLGEASAIVCCLREQKSGDQVIFLTNDGGASAVAAANNVDARHFGHALRELVCAGLLACRAAQQLLTRAVNVSGIPESAMIRTADDFACTGTTEACATCDLLMSAP